MRVHRGNCPRRMARDRLGAHYSCYTGTPLSRGLVSADGIYVYNIYIEHVVLFIYSAH